MSRFNVGWESLEAIMGRDHRFLRLLTAFSRRRPNNDENAVVTTRRCKLCLKGILHPLDGIFADGKNGKFIPATVILHLRMSIFNYGTFFTPREKWNENLGKSKLRFRNGKLTFDGSYINKRRS